MSAPWAGSTIRAPPTEWTYSSRLESALLFFVARPGRGRAQSFKWRLQRRPENRSPATQALTFPGRRRKELMPGPPDGKPIAYYAGSHFSWPTLLDHFHVFR